MRHICHPSPLRVIPHYEVCPEVANECVDEEDDYDDDKYQGCKVGAHVAASLGADGVDLAIHLAVCPP